LAQDSEQLHLRRRSSSTPDGSFDSDVDSTTTEDIRAQTTDFAHLTEAATTQARPPDVGRCAAGTTVACSFTAEVTAAAAGLDLLADALREVVGRIPTPCTVRWVTDSRGLLQALALGPQLQKDQQLADIWGKLLALRPLAQVKAVFSFGHCGVAVNEVADRVAAHAVRLPPSSTAWWVDVARARHQPDIDAEDERVRPLLRFLPTPTPSFMGPRWPARTIRLVGQLRTGVCPTLGGLRQEVTDQCPRCGQAELGREGRAVEHLFSCPEPGASGRSSSTPRTARHPRRALEYLDFFIGRSSDGRTTGGG
jgi:hypothetical protein